MIRPPGGIVGAPPQWTPTATSGVFTLREAQEMLLDDTWPRDPVAPTNLAATVGDARLSLTWTAPATTYGTITNYLIEYAQSGGPSQYVLTNNTSTSYTLTGLTNDIAHTVRVAAVTFTMGAYSAAVTLTPMASVLVEYLVVAGGGGAGTGAVTGPFSGFGVAPGGGGAGGFVYGQQNFAVGSILNTVVGAGGLGGLVGCDDKYNYIDTSLMATSNVSQNGGNSQFGSITAIGGGRGGQLAHNGPIKDGGFCSGGNGGSGGGAGRSSGPRSGDHQGQAGGSGTAGQGNSGANTGINAGGGGAGGAGSVGGASNSIGAGGPGISNSITGQSITYAAGGAAGGAANGANNTGNGGSSYFAYTLACSGRVSHGGSGVVILVVPAAKSLTLSGGLVYTVDTISRPNFKIYRITSGSGAVTI